MLIKKWIIIIFILIAVGIFVFRDLSDQPQGSNAVVNLSSSSISSSKDSDGDGVPDWLEDVSGTDITDSTSFPYQRDLARAKNVTVDELLYGGPGEFTEEIVKRFLDEGSEVVITDEEKEKFVSLSADYFIERTNRRGLPRVELKNDDSVDVAETLNDFSLSLAAFSEEKISYEQVTLEVFASNTSILPTAKRLRSSCEYALEKFPRSVPVNVYQPYFVILERITFLCEALKTSLNSNDAENYFYAIKLFNSGSLFDNLEDLSEESTQGAFSRNIIEVVNGLRNR